MHRFCYLSADHLYTYDLFFSTLFCHKKVQTIFRIGSEAYLSASPCTCKNNGSLYMYKYPFSLYVHILHEYVRYVIPYIPVCNLDSRSSICILQPAIINIMYYSLNLHDV